MKTLRSLWYNHSWRLSPLAILLFGAPPVERMGPAPVHEDGWVIEVRGRVLLEDGLLWGLKLHHQGWYWRASALLPGGQKPDEHLAGGVDPSFPQVEQALRNARFALAQPGAARWRDQQVRLHAGLVGAAPVGM